MTLHPDHEDAIKEVVNIGIGRAAATLSELMGTRIELALPHVAIGAATGPRGLMSRLGPAAAPPLVAIAQDFSGPCSGRAALVLPLPCGIRLARILGGVEGGTDELDIELCGILTEVGNIMLNGVLGSLANALDAWLAYGVPRFYGALEPALLAQADAAGDGRGLMIADAHFQVRQSEIRGSLVIVFEGGSLEAILKTVCGVEVGA